MLPVDLDDGRELGDAPALAHEGLAGSERGGSAFSQVHSLARGLARRLRRAKRRARCSAALELSPAGLSSRSTPSRGR